ncbi:MULTISPECIES: cobalamin biosynthesis protein [Sphingomonas]|uniref:Cobalamin biosynthesis protein n=1 Tax=Sphingomonas kyungheensis TaxID=1069987 RepID=A0ABU8H6V0_9SPHN|nr:cobalamin biosynthesis protein [Sphingomonas sp. RIT328]EZP54320.1 Precorrin methylase [Sphingomonas sp. RIT328]
MIVAGFGWRSGATPMSCEAALALARHGCPGITALAAPDDKVGLLAPLAERLGLALLPVTAAALTGVATATRSRASFEARGTGSVAEAAALAAIGEGARLIASRHVSPDRMATCAIAQGPST